MNRIPSASETLLDQQFHIQNGAARRQLSIPINGPAVTWQSGFWKPAEYTANDWRLFTDRAVFDLYRNMKKFVSDRIESRNIEGDHINLFRNRAGLGDRILRKAEEFSRDPVKLLIPFKGSSLRLVAEMSKEYWTLTYVLEVFVPDYYAKREGRADPPPHIISIQSKLNRLIEQLNQDRERSSQNLSVCVDDTNSLVRDFCEYIYSAVNEKVAADAENWRGPAPWGGKFFDFRGLIIPCTTTDPDLIKERKWFLTKSWRKEGDLASDTISPCKKPSVKEWVKLVDRVWPAIQGMHRKNPSPEISASTFQDGRSIYISSLGRGYSADATAQDPPDSRIGSVRYLVLVSHHSKWELGRLIDRIHRADVNRVAAMRDIPGIEEATDKLDQLRFEISEDWADLVSSRHRKGRAMSPRKRLAERHAKLEAIQNLSALSGGLEYRVFRSRYHIQQFRHHAKALRIGRVVGFQQYDEFVERRLSAAFESVKMTLERYKEARSELDTLFQRVQADLMINLTRTAEIIVGTGGVYYAGSIIIKLVHATWHAESEKVDASIFVALILVFTWWVIKRKRSH